MSLLIPLCIDVKIITDTWYSILAFLRTPDQSTFLSTKMFSSVQPHSAQRKARPVVITAEGHVYGKCCESCSIDVAPLQLLHSIDYRARALPSSPPWRAARSRAQRPVDTMRRNVFTRTTHVQTWAVKHGWSYFVVGVPQEEQRGPRAFGRSLKHEFLPRDRVKMADAQG